MSYPPPSAAPAQDAFALFRPVCQKYEIGDFFAAKLRQLEGFDIVVIADDSGSMNSPSSMPNADPYARKPTRWDELKQMLRVVIEVAVCLDKDGIDIYFLNRGKISNAVDVNSIEPAFAAPPAGYTPTARILRQVLADKRASIAERKLLIFIATDGEPTTDSGVLDVQSVHQILMYERDPNKVFVQFVACTDDSRAVAFLNQWDNTIPKLDVVDDYQSERAEIIKAQGANFRFTYGDYVVKALLGSVDTDMDKLDSKQAGGDACCTIL